MFEKEPLTEDDIFEAYNECESQMEYLQKLIYGFSNEEAEDNFKRLMQKMDRPHRKEIMPAINKEAFARW